MARYFTDIWQAVSSALVGMSITIKHIWKKPVTLQYPDERQVLSPRFRGFVHNDMNKCDACMICARACPVDCIYIETEGKGKDRWMTRYAIDYNKCIWCSLCTEGCPTNSITMSHDYDHSVYLRESLVYEYIDPTVQKIPCHKEIRKELGFHVMPRPEKKKPAAERKAEVEKKAAQEKAAEEKTAETEAETTSKPEPGSAAQAESQPDPQKPQPGSDAKPATEKEPEPAPGADCDSASEEAPNDDKGEKN